jgi:hypothetical protein
MSDSVHKSAVKYYITFWAMHALYNLLCDACYTYNGLFVLLFKEICSHWNCFIEIFIAHVKIIYFVCKIFVLSGQG